VEEKQAFHQKLQSMQAEIAQKEQIIMDLALQLRQACCCDFCLHYGRYNFFLPELLICF
jgi:hypothetical protein